MAQKQVVTITDDIDGREGAETISFAYADRTYEIDLGEKNRLKLEKALQPFIEAARRSGAPARSGRSGGRRKSSSSAPDRAAVRAWAIEQGLTVSHRGRLSKRVVQAYQQAH